MTGSEEGRARAGSTSTAGESEMRPWVGVGSGMETISEKRSRQGSEDGFKVSRGIWTWSGSSEGTTLTVPDHAE